LDTAVYWYGPNDTPERATGQASKFYDPAKPTIIFVHGWAGLDDPIAKCARWTTLCPEDLCPDKRSYAEPWLQMGWNYGMYYWDQLADEHYSRDTELKIWINPSAPKGLAWKSYDPDTNEVKFYEYDPSVVSVGHACSKSIQQALSGFRGTTLRFIGHSLGAQLAAHCAQVLHEEIPGHPAAPTRVTMLDPWYTGNLQEIGRKIRAKTGPLQAWLFHNSSVGHKHWGRLPVEASVRAIQALWKRGVATELFKGSWVTMKNILGDAALELCTITAYVESNLDAGFCSHNPDCAHGSVVPIYMLRINEEKQPLVRGGSPAGTCTMPGPACSDEQIVTFVLWQSQFNAKDKMHKWVQVDGIDTMATNDDVYEEKIVDAPTDTKMGAPTEQYLVSTVAQPSLRNATGGVLSKAALQSQTYGKMVLGITSSLCCCALCMGIIMYSSFSMREKSEFDALKLHDMQNSTDFYDSDLSEES
jgi:pimeloyl-ACP methyl ester carboxylesterase